MSYRPFEVNGELDGLLGHCLDAVVGQDGREPFAEGALVLGINCCLIMFQAYAKSCRANAGANARRGLEAVAAMAGNVFAESVLEALEVQLENSLTPAAPTDLEGLYNI